MLKYDISMHVHDIDMYNCHICRWLHPVDWVDVYVATLDGLPDAKEIAISFYYVMLFINFNIIF